MAVDELWRAPARIVEKSRCRQHKVTVESAIASESRTEGSSLWLARAESAFRSRKRRIDRWSILWDAQPNVTVDFFKKEINFSRHRKNINKNH
jgi:hypothetical protein